MLDSEILGNLLLHMYALRQHWGELLDSWFGTHTAKVFTCICSSETHTQAIKCIMALIT